MFPVPPRGPAPALAWPGLKGPVGNGFDNDPADVQAVKRRLHSLGLYEEPAYGFTGYIDRDTERGIRALQKREGLKIDGWLEPGGETEKALGHAFAGTRPNLLDFALDSGGTQSPVHLALFQGGTDGPVTLPAPLPSPKPKLPPNPPHATPSQPAQPHSGTQRGLTVPWFSLGDQMPTEAGNFGRPGRAAAQWLARQPYSYPGYPAPPSEEELARETAAPMQEGFAGTPEELEAWLLERNTGLAARQGAIGRRWLQLDKQKQARWDAAKDVMADELRTILSATRPGRASWPHTNKTTDIAIRQFISVLEEEFPQLVGHVFHIAGGTVEGKGETRMNEKQILDPNAPSNKKTLGSVGPDMMIAIMQNEKPLIVGGVNGASTKADGTLTAKEEKSFRRFVNLVDDPQLAQWIEKLESMGQDDTKTHKEARNAARVLLMGMERLIIERGLLPGESEAKK